MQRMFDVVLSGIAVFMLAPFLLGIVALLRFTGEGEVFYRQERIGKGGLPFNVLKFATMLKNSESMGTGTITIKNDPRVLPVGRFLRKTKVNELPQLFNVLLGDMSLIGPRPQEIRCFEAFPLESRSLITSVRPGLSGVGSLFFRDEESLMEEAVDKDWFYDEVVMPYKAQLEVWYVNNRTISVYFKLILLTISIVVRPRSARLGQYFKSVPAPPEALA